MTEIFGFSFTVDRSLLTPLRFFRLRFVLGEVYTAKAMTGRVTVPRRAREGDPRLKDPLAKGAVKTTLEPDPKP